MNKRVSLAAALTIATRGARIDATHFLQQLVGVRTIDVGRARPSLAPLIGFAPWLAGLRDTIRHD